MKVTLTRVIYFLGETFKKRYELLLYLINHDVKQKQRNRRNRETI